jgi:hypothetical protein
MAFNNGPKLVTQGLNLLVDAGDPTSYPGSGTTWRDVVGGQNGTITGSVSYSSAFYGGLVFSGPTASVIFPTSSANFGTGSFTVELAFRPERIQGIHYLISKNSGSFPSWGVYLSGSGGSGKLFSEYRISSTVSCSVSSSTTFVTGSNYLIDVEYTPAYKTIFLVTDASEITDSSANNTTSTTADSLSSTGSLFIGNSTSSSLQVFSGSLYNAKIYSATLSGIIQNFNAVAPRLSKAVYLPPSTVAVDSLIIAGGGGGGSDLGGGGGAGGFIFTSSLNLTRGTTYSVFVGSGGSSSTNGVTSSFANIVAIGGGGAGFQSVAAKSGGSGGGSGWGSALTGSGTSGQGNRGGIGNFNYASGGGGGAGTSGSNALNGSTPGRGGSGSFIGSFGIVGGSPVGWFAGGGGGGGTGAGGIGGGGSASQQGSTNTGGGGGGGVSPGASGFAGGSGVVAIRYAGTPTATGGTIISFGPYTYHVFTTTGSSTFTVF